MRDIDTRNNNYSFGESINSSGIVVGRMTVPSNSGYLVYHGFIYIGGQMKDLNNLVPKSSGWVLDDATGINDAGQIVGSGTLNGQTRAFLLK
jgi:hypothetical protein